ncbi:hypothetical protein OG496_55180 [Streptomyces sp. NBC_00988]|uniref:hypothetical protein n=1 Tax=Streptomyces sp. NBC_00988 TaxID=2903704 RepID=UPI003863E21A|nr:hypothetical protein OG496_00105 [Streptomyces sp. NBC_00988]WSX17737.1 hypothetical protein OG496_55180 [Streptomyces sp. NBC_00988]
MHDDPLAHLLQNVEVAVDIDPGSLQQRKHALREWMTDADCTSPPAAATPPTSHTQPPRTRPRFIVWNPELTLKPLAPGGATEARLRRAVGDHAHAAPAASSPGHRQTCRDEAAEAALNAVSELRNRLTLLRPAASTRLLQRVLADAEDELTRTGQLSARLHMRLRTMLADTSLNPELQAPAGVVARLLAGD